MAVPAFVLQIFVVLLAVQQGILADDKSTIQGIPTFSAGTMSDFRLSGNGTMAEYSSSIVEGQSFEWGIRVRVPKRTDNSWDAQILTPPSSVPLKKGEQILAIFNVRCIDAPSGSGVFSAHIQGSGAPWTGIASTDVVVGKKWKRIYIHGQAHQDFDKGKFELTLHLGAQAQTLEVGGFEMINLGRNVDLGKLPFSKIRYPGDEPDAAWRKAAAERIEKDRKADLTVTVLDRDGRPVEDAKLRIQMQKHAYGFGTFLEYEVMNGPGDDSKKLREWTLKLFNRCTTPIYWADWGWANPDVRKKYLESAKWAFDNELSSRGHCIIYPGWEFLPAAIRGLENNPTALRKRLLEHIVEVCEATRNFKFTEYDVTNELRHLKEVHGLLGRDAVVEWFKVARQHAPDSRMAINENTILTRGGFTESEQDNYAEWIQYLDEHGQGPDIIGMQGHFSGEALTDPETVLRILSRFAKFDKAIQITEFDIATRDEEGQARYTRDFLTAVFSHPATNAFTMWGFWEGKMWQPAAAMIRKDWSLKPNGQAWMDLVLNEWWTDLAVSTGPDGSCTQRGFLGDYKISISFAGKEKSILVKLAKPGSKAVIVLD